MAHTNQTAHYHLPQYVGTDIINPLTDTNKAYEDIDTALYEQGQSIAGVVDDIDALKIQNGDNALDTTAQTLSGAINELKSDADALGLRVTTNETNIGTLQTQMSTATGNITTLNTSVAGLQTEVASKASATAVDNLTAKVGTGNLATVAQNCVDAINEVNAKIPEGGSVEADDVVYDNTDSGLTATNVQDAIDEVNGKDAGDIAYDNTTSGLTATDVQNAIDEIAGGTFKTLRASSTAGGTYSAQLTELVTAWNALSDSEKAESYLIAGGYKYYAMGLADGSYSRLGGSQSGIASYNMVVTTHVANSLTGSALADLSSTVLSGNIKLYA